MAGAGQDQELRIRAIPSSPCTLERDDRTFASAFGAGEVLLGGSRNVADGVVVTALIMPGTNWARQLGCRTGYGHRQRWQRQGARHRDPARSGNFTGEVSSFSPFSRGAFSLSVEGCTRP